MKTISLAELKQGEHAVIKGLERSELGNKLMEMGLLVGETIEVNRIAPLGDPIAFKIGNYLLSLRKDEAAAVKVELIMES